MTDFTRTLEDLASVTDAPTKKTSTGIGVDLPIITDFEGNIVAPGVVNDALNLTDLTSVVKSPSPGGDNSLNITDAGSLDINGLVGTDNLGLTDFVSVSSSSVITWTVSVTDLQNWVDLDAQEASVLQATPEDALNRTDLLNVTQGGGQVATVENALVLNDPLSLSRTQILPDDSAGTTDDAPTVTKTGGVFVTRTIEDQTRFTDNDGAGDTSNFLTVTFVLGLQAGGLVNDTAGLLDDLTITTQNALKVFVGPTVSERPADDVLWFYKHQVGVTVVQHMDNTWTQVRYPVDSDLQGQQRVYRGGYEYVLSDDDVAALTAAGFGAYIQQDDPVVTHEPGVPVGV